MGLGGFLGDRQSRREVWVKWKGTEQQYQELEPLRVKARQSFGVTGVEAVWRMKRDG